MNSRFTSHPRRTIRRVAQGAALFASLVALTASCRDDRVTAPRLTPGAANRDIEISTGALKVELRYGGALLSDLGMNWNGSCPFQVNIDPTAQNTYGDYVAGLCGSSGASSYVINGLPVGQHTFQIRFTANSSPVVAEATVDLAAGQTTTQAFALETTLAMVTGSLTVNGQAPGANRYVICAYVQQNAYPCTSPDATTGAFKLLDLPGSRVGAVRSTAVNLPFFTFPYSATAGQTADVGTVASEAATLAVDLRYAGDQLANVMSRTDYCWFYLSLDPTPNYPYGQFASSICGSDVTRSTPVTVADLPTGTHTYALVYYGPPAAQGTIPIIASTPVTLAAGATTTQVFDLSSRMGVVTGTVTSGGQPAGANAFLACLATFNSNQPCVSTGDGGAFKLLDLAGSREATARPYGQNAGGAKFTYTLTAGATVDAGAVNADQGALSVELRYHDASLASTGFVVNYHCPFYLYADPTTSNPSGTYVQAFCDQAALSGPITISGLTAGTHRFQLQWIGPGAVRGATTYVATFDATIALGQTARQVVELSTTMGLVKGVLKVNGAAPPPYQYVICPSTFAFPQPCVGIQSTDGSFAYFDVPGARTGRVKGWSGSAAISEFGYTMNAGQTTTVGNTTGAEQGNTPVSASAVTVKPVDSNTGDQPVDVTFSSVTESGQTTLSTSDVGPAPPADMQTGTPAVYYDIATSATFAGPATVCVNFSNQTFNNPNAVRLLHGGAGGTWTDITSSLSTGQQKICGTTTSFSPFLVAEPKRRPPVAQIGVSASGGLLEGSAIAFDGGSSTASGSIASYEWDFDGDGVVDATGRSVEHTFNTVGSHTVALRVTDDAGATSTASTSVTIANVAPTVTVGGDQSVFKRAKVTLEASVSDPGAGEDWRYTVNWGDGTVDDAAENVLAAPGALPQLTHAYTSSAGSPYVVSVSVVDNHGGVDAKSFKVTVTNRSPAITSMGGPYSVTEGGSVAFAPSSADPDGDPLRYSWNFSGARDASGKLVEESTLASPTQLYKDDKGQPFTATLTVTDDEGLSATQGVAVSATNAKPVIVGQIQGLPAGPIPAGTAVTLSVDFTDAGVLDQHAASTITWDVGAGETSIPLTGIQEPGDGPGRVSATKILGAGVYTVTMTVRDDGGAIAQIGAPAYLVVYDPSAGFVTGGGWITSPTAACQLSSACSGAVGKASFGFVARYRTGQSTPDGNTEFQFQAGGLKFSSTSYEWLVVAGSKAQYKGRGTVNGAGSYGFLITAIDGDLRSTGDADQFRIKIWDVSTGAVVYDNKLGSPDDSDDATTLGGGSIQIHK